MRSVAFVSVIVFIVSGALLGVSADEAKGKEIAKRYFDLKTPDNSTAEATMTIIDKKGRERSRVLKIITMSDEKGTHSFMEFEEPADVKGTRFLSLPDEQRIYLPALRRVRLIASSGKGGKFVGSDFYFYDLEDRSFDDHTYKFLKTQKDGEREFDIIEMISKDPDAPYEKAQAWVDRNDNFVYKMNLYDKKSGDHIKTMSVINTEIIDGCIIPVEIEMKNVRDNQKTTLKLKNLKVNEGVNKSVFTVQNLESR